MQQRIKSTHITPNANGKATCFFFDYLHDITLVEEVTVYRNVDFSPMIPNGLVDIHIMKALYEDVTFYMWFLTKVEGKST